MDDAAIEKRLDALSRVLLSTRETVAHQDRVLLGDGNRAGLPTLVAEARGGILDLTKEYRQDRHNAVLFYQQKIEPRQRAMEDALAVVAENSLRTVKVAIGFGLASILIAGSALIVALSQPKPQPAQAAVACVARAVP